MSRFALPRPHNEQHVQQPRTSANSKFPIGHKLMCHHYTQNWCCSLKFRSWAQSRIVKRQFRLVNIQGLKLKVEILETESQPYDILVFTETWKGKETSSYQISNPLLDVTDKTELEGGVAVYVHNGIQVTPRPD